VSNEIFALERQVAEAQERLAQLAERQVLRKLRTLHMSAFVQVMAVHLHRSGFGSMMPVSRGTEKEFHLSVLDRRRGGRFRTAVVLVQAPSNDSINERAVMDLRGSLHHYDATSGMIATTGTVSTNARDEALVANLAPVALVDGDMLSREMVRLGIGVCERRMSLPSYDETFFTSLGT
jgi:restriction endonuclease Mrr